MWEKNLGFVKFDNWNHDLEGCEEKKMRSKYGIDVKEKTQKQTLNEGEPVPQLQA